MANATLNVLSKHSRTSQAKHANLVSLNAKTALVMNQTALNVNFKEGFKPFY